MVIMSTKINNAETKMMYKVCLIVDNPIRDLEGIILIAWHLAKKNIICYIVPMYCQAFDVISLKPDLVLVNYLRPNNVNLLLRYKKENIKICILDTEGSPGKDLSKYASFVNKIKEKKLVDMYCLWGEEQYKAFKEKKLFNDNIVKITGCPRYDFCVYPYNQTLPKLFCKKRFILINTTFPVGNPKFTRDFKIEEKAMVDMGYDKVFAKNYAKDSFNANRKLVNILSKICQSFPNFDFVLRPHPFESSMPYKKLLKNKNFQICQTQTAIEWLNCCEALIHLNCQTAIESVMMNKEPISIEWINTPHLKAQGPPGNLSHNANNFEELSNYINNIINNKMLKPSKKMINERNHLIKSRLFNNDGFSSFRVSKVINELLLTNKTSLTLDHKNKFNHKQVAREVLGFKIFHWIRRVIQGQKAEFRRNEKNFTLKEVELIIKRLNKIDSNKITVKANKVLKNDLSIPKMFSHKTIKISI